MASNHIKINTNRLNSDAERIAGLIQTMKKELSNMKGSVNDMNKMWEGPTKIAFMQAVNRDTQALQDLINSLESIQKYEVSAKKEYEKCESQVSQLVDSIRV